MPAARPAAKTKPKKATPASAHAVDLDRYSPAYFTWIANKLANGASKAYKNTFGVGIEVWRVLVLLAIHPAMTAQAICRILGIDKATISRTLRSMQADELITIALDPNDGRARVARITPKGQDCHDGMMRIAVERERAFLSVLSTDEQEQLISMLRRLHENLPAVEQRTTKFVASEFAAPAAGKRKGDAPARKKAA